MKLTCQLREINAVIIRIYFDSWAIAKQLGTLYILFVLQKCSVEEKVQGPIFEKSSTKTFISAALMFPL